MNSTMNMRNDSTPAKLMVENKTLWCSVQIGAGLDMAVSDVRTLKSGHTVVANAGRQVQIGRLQTG
jgi:hypothetical protein